MLGSQEAQAVKPSEAVREAPPPGPAPAPARAPARTDSKNKNIRPKFFIINFTGSSRRFYSGLAGVLAGQKTQPRRVRRFGVLCLVSAWSLLGLCSPGVPDLARSFTFLGKRFRFGAKLP